MSLVVRGWLADTKRSLKSPIHPPVVRRSARLHEFVLVPARISLGEDEAKISTPNSHAETWIRITSSRINTYKQFLPKSLILNNRDFAFSQMLSVGPVMVPKGPQALGIDRTPDKQDRNHRAADG